MVWRLILLLLFHIDVKYVEVLYRFVPLYDCYMTALCGVLVFQVYNDANILEKILREKRRELGPMPDEDDIVSPKLKISE